jgi:hypothetical protein
LEIKGFYELALSQKLKSRESSIERFLANGDREGFLKTELAFFKTEIPNALRQAVQRVIPAKPGPRPVATQTRTIQTGPVKPPVAGFTRVKMPPSGDQIDWSAMSREQLKVSDGKFILKDGSRQML